MARLARAPRSVVRGDGLRRWAGRDSRAHAEATTFRSRSDPHRYRSPTRFASTSSSAARGRPRCDTLRSVGRSSEQLGRISSLAVNARSHLRRSKTTWTVRDEPYRHDSACYSDWLAHRGSLGITQKIGHLVLPIRMAEVVHRHAEDLLRRRQGSRLVGAAATDSWA